MSERPDPLGMPGPKLLLVGAIAAVIAALITGPGLWKVCAVRGWLPGAVTKTETVTKLWVEQSTNVRRWAVFTDKAHWVSWAPEGDVSLFDFRANMEQDAWAALHVGDRIEVIRLGGDGRPYVRGDVSSSNSSLVFDLVLFAVEAGLALYVTVRLVRAWRRASQEPGPRRKRA